jgi:Trypsin-co-occurring domain 2
MAQGSWVGLAETVRGLRAELIAAQAQAPGDTVRFELGPIEMEFGLTVSRDVDGKAGVRIGVVTLGAGGSISSESVHRVKFVLTPKDAQTGGALEIASQMAEIPER